MIISNRSQPKSNNPSKVSSARLCWKLPFRDVKYLTNKKDKDLEDEQCMMENHRCYGEGKSPAVWHVIYENG